MKGRFQSANSIDLGPGSLPGRGLISPGSNLIMFLVNQNQRMDLSSNRLPVSGVV